MELLPQFNFSNLYGWLIHVILLVGISGGDDHFPNAFSRRRSWQGARLRQSDSLRAPPTGSLELPSEVDVNPSMISDAASEAYHHTFDTTEGMSEDERQRLMSPIQASTEGRARVLRPYLARAPEIVDGCTRREIARCSTLLPQEGH